MLDQQMSGLEVEKILDSMSGDIYA